MSPAVSCAASSRNDELDRKLLQNHSPVDWSVAVSVVQRVLLAASSFLSLCPGWTPAQGMRHTQAYPSARALPSAPPLSKEPHTSEPRTLPILSWLRVCQRDIDPLQSGSYYAPAEGMRHTQAYPSARAPPSAPPLSKEPHTNEPRTPPIFPWLRVCQRDIDPMLN